MNIVYTYIRQVRYKMDNNFKWIIEDINDSMIVRVTYHDKDGNLITSTCKCQDIFKLDTTNLDITSGNILDMQNLLLGLLRFIPDTDNSIIIDIPLRNLLVLYEKTNKLDHGSLGRDILLKELHGFSSSDVEVIEPYSPEEPSEDLQMIMKISHNFPKLTPSEELQSLMKLNELNQERLKSKGYGR